MGKIKGWDKVINSRMNIEWVNEHNHKVRMTARANNFGGKNYLWTLAIFNNEGQYVSREYSNSIRYGSMTKSDALYYATRYMRSHPNG